MIVNYYYYKLREEKKTAGSVREADGLDCGLGRGGGGGGGKMAIGKKEGETRLRGRRNVASRISEKAEWTDRAGDSGGGDGKKKGRGQRSRGGFSWGCGWINKYQVEGPIPTV